MKKTKILKFCFGPTSRRQGICLDDVCRPPNLLRNPFLAPKPPNSTILFVNVSKSWKTLIFEKNAKTHQHIRTFFVVDKRVSILSANVVSSACFSSRGPSPRQSGPPARRERGRGTRAYVSCQRAGAAQHGWRGGIGAHCSPQRSPCIGSCTRGR